jgi:hypothetical protein
LLRVIYLHQVDVTLALDLRGRRRLCGDIFARVSAAARQQQDYRYRQADLHPSCAFH